ncbi:hypothetical protein BVRB_5g108760 [Beta vulgaris subsp. vulgaris]|nr:hypothetical protein BVRB_5g108760 [Beta vulgaris subsp. vulgaris]
MQGNRRERLYSLLLWFSTTALPLLLVAGVVLTPTASSPGFMFFLWGVDSSLHIQKMPFSDSR